MDDLDFLKSHWQKDNRFPQIKADQIRKMLHRSSSSIVKWIFIISIIELFLGVALGVALPTDDPIYDHIVFQVLNVTFYIFIFYFIYQFFTSFQRIRTTQDTKSLLSSILRTRKLVELYIKINVYMILLGLVSGGVVSVIEHVDSRQSAGEIIFYVIAFAVIMTLIGGLFYLLIRLYYRIVYGILLKKLNKNYDELVALDSESDDSPLS